MPAGLLLVPILLLFKLNFDSGGNQASVSAINDTVCPYGATTITVTGIGGNVTYKWNTGATSSSISVHDTVTTTYTVTIYGICDSTKEMKTVTCNSAPKAHYSRYAMEMQGNERYTYSKQRC